MEFRSASNSQGPKLSTASNGSLITSATPAFVLLFAFFLLRGKDNRQASSCAGSLDGSARWRSLTRARPNYLPPCLLGNVLVVLCRAHVGVVFHACAQGRQRQRPAQLQRGHVVGRDPIVRSSRILRNQLAGNRRDHSGRLLSAGFSTSASSPLPLPCSCGITPSKSCPPRSPR
jgi:hypothetical protein